MFDGNYTALTIEGIENFIKVYDFIYKRIEKDAGYDCSKMPEFVFDRRKKVLKIISPTGQINEFPLKTFKGKN